MILEGLPSGIKWNDSNSTIPSPKKKQKNKGKPYDPKQGFYSTVYPHPKDPFLVIKQEDNFTDPETNGYNQWVRTIANRMQKNIFLPRVYIAKSETAPDGVKKRYKYVIEKLFHPQSVASQLGKVDVRLIRFMGHRLIKNFEELLKKQQELKKSSAANKVERAKITRRGITKNDVWNLIIRTINDALKTGNFDQLNDYRLIDACKLVLGAKSWIPKPSGQSGETGIDVHPYNAMVRFTSKGPQIVITDPLS